MNMYTHKVSEVAKWRNSWDEYPEDVKTNRALKGQQIRGTGKSSAPWVYGKHVQPFELVKNTEIEKQVADFIDFARDRCHIPENYWLNESAKKAQDESSKNCRILGCRCSALDENVHPQSV